MAWGCQDRGSLARIIQSWLVRARRCNLLKGKGTLEERMEGPSDDVG